MLNLHLTHTGLFHLERLESVVRERYKKDFDIENDESLARMLQFASHIQDVDIQREFLLFYLNCGPEVQDLIKNDDAMFGDSFVQGNNS